MKKIVNLGVSYVVLLSDGLVDLNSFVFFSLASCFICVKVGLYFNISMCQIAANHDELMVFNIGGGMWDVFKEKSLISV